MLSLNVRGPFNTQRRETDKGRSGKVKEGNWSEKNKFLGGIN